MFKNEVNKLIKCPYEHQITEMKILIYYVTTSIYRG